jgi:hypothetical protein
MYVSKMTLGHPFVYGLMHLLIYVCKCALSLLINEKFLTMGISLIVFCVTKGKRNSTMENLILKSVME